MFDKYPALAIIPPEVLAEINKALSTGKYDGWWRGFKTDESVTSTEGHWGKWKAGELADKDNGHHPLSAVIVRSMLLMDRDFQKGKAQEVINVQNLKCHSISGSALPVCRTGCG